MPDRAVMGCLAENGAVVAGSEDALLAEMRAAVRGTGGRRLILAGGCSLPDDIAPARPRWPAAAPTDSWSERGPARAPRRRRRAPAGTRQRSGPSPDGTCGPQAAS